MGEAGHRKAGTRWLRDISLTTHHPAITMFWTLCNRKKKHGGNMVWTQCLYVLLSFILFFCCSYSTISEVSSPMLCIVWFNSVSTCVYILRTSTLCSTGLHRHMTEWYVGVNVMKCLLFAYNECSIYGLVSRRHLACLLKRRDFFTQIRPPSLLKRTTTKNW